ncbi:YlaH-like family protein [Evansella cellulosilytica]|uniref:YlaH-like protein n=1 Tax=Evansella cellulosilytica (strain ATCC 21833 / DSM 2522 / FERM P-1141 / JCM 9156 / N-4) TaxID=649639 RepID=E6TUL7_EVAC2|nr:YlaH-like family protein [Evansella cellulosilytica]ADU30907.1 hypothetical protein Bcell_2652 [Evansella cellulosilytica DSM 2522]
MYLATLQEREPNPNLTPIAEWLGAGDPENFFFAFTVIYLITTALTVLVFNLGFAKKLPILKMAIVYIVMLIGNILITFLAFALPIVESLFVAALVLSVYKVQLKRHKKAELVEQEADHDKP